MNILPKIFFFAIVCALLQSSAIAAPPPDIPYRFLKPWNHAWIKKICLEGRKEIPQYFQRKNVCWKIDVNSKGEIIEEELVRSSGSDLHDLLALNIIERAAPFPCPTGLRGTEGIIKSARISISSRPSLYLNASRGSRRRVSKSITNKYLGLWFKNTEKRLTVYRNLLLSKYSNEKNVSSNSIYSPILLKFKLTVDGRVIDLSQLKSSNIDELDNVAKKTLVACSPLSGVPSKLPQQFGLVAMIPTTDSKPIKLRFSTQGRKNLVSGSDVSESKINAYIDEIVHSSTTVNHGDSIFKEISTRPPERNSTFVPYYNDVGAYNPRLSEHQFGHKWALIVGNSKFSGQKRALKYAEKDASDFYGYLTNNANFRKEHVKLLTGTEATRENVMRSIDWLRKRSSQEDLVFVYLRTPIINFDRDQKYCFACSNTSLSNPLSTGFEMQKFPRLVIDKVRSAELAIVIDSDYACRAAGQGFRPTRGFSRANIYRNRFLLICSSRRNKRSHESNQYQNSIFTHNLIEGLQKKGNSARLLETVKSIRPAIYKELTEINPNCEQGGGYISLSLDDSKSDTMLASPSLYSKGEKSNQKRKERYRKIDWNANVANRKIRRGPLFSFW